MISILRRVQNRILHNQLEALHIRLAEKERSIAGLSSQRTDSHGEDDLHSVISYLRRSKEIVSTLSGVPFAAFSLHYMWFLFTLLTISGRNRDIIA